MNYLVQSSRGRKLWVPYGGPRFPPPRLKQIVAIVVCAAWRHRWTTWQLDDYEGPGELMDPDDDESFMPYCSRTSRPGEYGHRSCLRCGLGEARYPLHEAPPRMVGTLRWMPT